MAVSLSAGEVRWLRVLAQGLAPAFAGDLEGGAGIAAAVVARAGGLQGQDLNAAALQIRARSSGLSAASMHHMIAEERSVVRTWVMRGTLHLIPSEDHRWMTSLLGPIAFSSGRGRRLELGLDESKLERAHSLALDALTAEGPLTRAQLAERLAPHGIPVENQGLHHVVRSAGFLGLMTHGPLVDGKTETFVAADSWLAGVERPVLDREEALARLAGRYVRAFGPSTARDFAVWAGISLRDARAGWGAIEGELVEVEVGGEGMWLLGDGGGGLGSRFRGKKRVRLLGAFDTYLLGYRGRGLAVAAEDVSRVNAGGGMIRPVVIVDGLAVGTWGVRRRGGGRAEVIFEWFGGEVPAFAGMTEGERGNGGMGAGIEGEVGDVLRFMRVDSSLRSE